MSTNGSEVFILLENAEGATPVQLPGDLVSRARALPEDLWRYFAPVEGFRLVEVRHLVQTRMRPEGVGAAIDLMAEAYAGVRPPRAPLDVELMAPPLVRVLDGNSTATIAAAAGWRHVPCRLKAPAGAP